MTQIIMQGQTSNNPSSGEIIIRPFPYPYKAAFAFCNDLDGITSFAQMKTIHDVLNGRKDTPCGPGLNLETGDSFHFYSVHPEQDDTFSYFHGDTKKVSRYAAAIREGISAGILDTMHTWGNFSQKGGFFREHAERGLEELEKYGLKVPVWTNHGDIHNFQNIGRPDSFGDVPDKSSSRGDRSRVLEYHGDIARLAGIRYVWIKELTNVVGQERPLEPADWLESGIDLGKNALKGIFKSGIGAGGIRPQQLSNELIKPQKLRDSSVLFHMLRYGFFEKDGADNLAELLTSKILRRLVEVQGAMLFYTHLGKGRVSPEKPFSREAYTALQRLAERAEVGDIWVTTPSRLCRYIELRQRLRFEVEVEQNAVKINSKYDRIGTLDEPDLSGLTVYAESADKCEISTKNMSMVLQSNPIDHTGRKSFSMPLKSIEYCWE